MKPYRPLLFALLLACWWPPTASAAEIRGQVTDEDGRPLAGALVEATAPAVGYEGGLRWIDGQRSPDALATATTGPDGSYRLDVPSDRLLHVLVTARGRIPMWRSLQPYPEDEFLALVRLAPDRGVDVTVEDATGRPLPGARVWHFSTDETAVAWRKLKRHGWGPVRIPEVTDEFGRARLPLLTDEALQVRAWAPGYGVSRRAESDGGSLRFRLRPTAPRRIEVQGADGEPVAGALVRVDRHGWSAAVTDEAGRAVVAPSTDDEDAEPGEAWVWVETASGRSLKAVLPPPPAPETDPDEPHVLVLPDPWRVSGRVTSQATGRPIPGALVWNPNGGSFTVGDARGSFTLAFSEAVEEVNLAAVAAGHGAARGRTSQALASRRSPTPLEITLPPVRKLRGRVVDAEGAPLAGARLSWTTAGGPNAARGLTPQILSDGDGSFVTGPLWGEGEVLVRAELGGYAPAETRVPLSRLEQPVEMVLTTGVSVTGQVVGPNGEAVAAARVRLFATRESGPMARFRSRWLHRGADPDHAGTSVDGGSFTVPHVAPGGYVMEIAAPGYAPRSVSRFEVGDAETYDVGRVELEAGLTLQGRVVDGDGRPVAEATVWLGSGGAGRLAVYSSSLRAEQSRTTGADGSFRFEDLAAGATKAVVAKKPGYAPATAENIQLAADEEAPSLELVLEPGARLFGQVVDTDGEPVPATTLRLMPPVMGMGRFEGQLDLSTDAEGRFDRDDLPLGRYEVHVGPPRPLDAAAAQTEIELLAGREVGPLRLVIAKPVVAEGRVVDADGAPVLGAEVSFEARSAEPRFRRRLGQGLTDGAGRFRAENLDPGPTRVTALHPESGRVDRDLELRPGTNAVDLQLRDSGRLDLHVTAAATGEPVADAQVEWRTSDGNADFVRTDPDGHAVIRPPAAGPVRVEIRAQGFRRARIDEVYVGESSAERLDVQLDRGLAIRGQILGLDPAELSRVQVTAFSNEQRGGASQVTTERDGSFLLEGLEPGSWSVIAGLIAPDRRSNAEVVLTEEQPEVFVELEFVDGFTLTVTVIVNGEPASGAMLSLTPLDAGPHGFGRTDHRGVYRFSDLTPGRYRLTPSADLMMGKPTEIEVLGDDELVIELDQGRVRGRAVTAEGAPASGARVLVMDPDNPYSSMIQSMAPRLTDAAGRFELSGIPPGDYRLQLTADDGATVVHPFTATPPVTDVGDLVLEPTGEVVLRLTVGSPGPPLDRVAVAAREASGALLTMNQYPVRDGQVRLRGLPDLARSLAVQAQGYAPVRVVRSVGGSEVYPVELVPGATLRVRVPELEAAGEGGRLLMADASGAPPLTLELMVQMPSMRDGFPLTGGLGTLSSISPGTWNVAVTASGGRTWSRAVTLQPGQTTDLVVE